ncbi:hypothetical protein [Nonomuraea solani]|nr:hypothetical protein [Nonomuraea solani]
MTWRTRHEHVQVIQRDGGAGLLGDIQPPQVRAALDDAGGHQPM